ncbi:8239_t:CDS:10 [Acaulospora morrowiae]|uniref:8239_t:CDS:1 n=1 Tax=Acaulospora morrowiae TaxID=94023 RepID=A0A9N9C6W8_9GLOM|nr:8239_t:CDS:10 [Acaulospora morrowiae]
MNEIDAKILLKKFEGYEDALDPNSLSLLSILKFRRTKDGFSFDKHYEHFTISRFMLYVAKITTDEKWKKATSVLSEGTLKASLSLYLSLLLVNIEIGRELGYVSKQPPKWLGYASGWEWVNISGGLLLSLCEGQRLIRLSAKSYIQAQSKEVKLFWTSVETEKVESKNKLLELRIKQAEIQFFVDRTLAGNAAHRIFDQKKIDYALNLNKNSIGKHSYDKGMEDACSYKYRRGGEDDEPLRTPEEKIRTVTYREKESSTSTMSYIPAIPVESSISTDLVIDTRDEGIFNMMLRETYLKIRQDIRSCLSLRDWNIEDYNVSRSFRDYQVANIDKLEDDGIYFFSSNIEEILSLHYIMMIDLTIMKRPTYVTVDERRWRASIRQPVQLDPASFFGDIMNEYEKVINDIDELRLKFFEIWGKYCDKVIYSDEERRLFETTQIVARGFYERMHMYPDSGKDENEDTVMHEYIHDTFKETFWDSKYVTVWANSESLSSKDYRSTHGRSQEKIDITIYRIIEKGKCEESCFVEARPFSITRTSKIEGYNLYKVAVFCQGAINNILLRENVPRVQTFGGHIYEGYIYFCMMDLEYDGIYRFFQLSEVKIARRLSEFNFVRKLILETYFFKRRIDNYYSNRYNHNRTLCSSRFVRNPTVTPKAPKNAIPDFILKKQKPTKKRKNI